MLIDHELPKFDERIYTKIALNDLVTYAVYFLSQSNNEISAEDIVAACFLLFPKRFELRGYPQWPDSTVVNKRWIDCRNKGFIKGKTAHGFTLAPEGLKVAERVGKILNSQIELKSKVPRELRTRAARFISALEKSDAYNLFIQGRQAETNEFDFRNMLLCTMESPATTLRNNLEQFKQHVIIYKRDDLIKFLNSCQEKFGHLLVDGDSGLDQFKGGMLRQKVK